MSKDNARRFLEIVGENPALQNTLQALVSNSKDQIVEQVIQLGEKNGYAFTEDDLMDLIRDKIAATQQVGEIDDDQLENIAGGIDAWDINSSMGFLNIPCRKPSVYKSPADW